MDIKIRLNASSPRGKISAIRTVINIGSLSYEDRLKHVLDILKEPIDTSPDAKFKADKAEIERILYPPKAPEYGHQKHRVCMYDENWNLIKVFESRKAVFAEVRFLAGGTLVAHCDLRRKSAYHVWEKINGRMVRKRYYFRWEWNYGPPPKSLDDLKTTNLGE